MHNEPKYCIDCKHHAAGWCNSPNLGKFLVTGEPITWLAYKCRIYESFPTCGLDGIWFEQKEKSVSFVQKIKQSCMSIWK